MLLVYCVDVEGIGVVGVRRCWWCCGSVGVRAGRMRGREGGKKEGGKGGEGKDLCHAPLCWT